MERVAKCRLNGTKKPPKRKARPNTTKYGPNAKLPKKRAKKQPENEIGQPPENESGQPPVTTPTRTRETILQESPNRLTRRYITSDIFYSHVQIFSIISEHILCCLLYIFRQLSILMEEETCARPQPTHNLMGEGTMATNKRTARKLIPRKRTS